MTRVSWLSDRRSPRLPALWAVADEGRSPMTVAGPRRIHTGFLRRHHLTGAIIAYRGAASVRTVQMTFSNRNSTPAAKAATVLSELSEVSRYAIGTGVTEDGWTGLSVRTQCHPASRRSGFQVPGTIGSDGPLPNMSPASVVNPAAGISASLCAVPAKPRGPAPWPDASADTTGSSLGGPPQSGSISTFISMNSWVYPRSLARWRRLVRAASRAAAAAAAEAVSGSGAFLFAFELAPVLIPEPTPMPGGATA